MSEAKKLNILLLLQQNSHSTSRKVRRHNKIRHSIVHKFLEKEKWNPYKALFLQELLEDNPNRRKHFCELANR